GLIACVRCVGGELLAKGLQVPQFGPQTVTLAREPARLPLLAQFVLQRFPALPERGIVDQGLRCICPRPALLRRHLLRSPPARFFLSSASVAAFASPSSRCIIGFSRSSRASNSALAVAN